MNIDSAACRILQRGVKLDNNKRYTEALVCYQEGLQLLMDSMTGETDGSKKLYLRKKIEDYINRAEQIKKHISEQTEAGKYHEQILIENNSTGHSYKSLFGRFLDESVSCVEVEDPYIRLHHQCQNFVRLCELLVSSCSNLQTIKLTTSHEGSQPDGQQRQWLHLLQSDLTKYNVNLTVGYSTTLHDRKIMLDTGWVIKIGRGLDLYKPLENKFSLGSHDLDMRPCHQTQVDIFHMRNVKTISQ